MRVELPELVCRSPAQGGFIHVQAGLGRVLISPRCWLLVLSDLAVSLCVSLSGGGIALFNSVCVEAAAIGFCLSPLWVVLSLWILGLM